MLQSRHHLLLPRPRRSKLLLLLVMRRRRARRQERLSRNSFQVSCWQIRRGRRASTSPFQVLTVRAPCSLLVVASPLMRSWPSHNAKVVRRRASCSSSTTVSTSTQPGPTPIWPGTSTTMWTGRRLLFTSGSLTRRKVTAT